MRNGDRFAGWHGECSSEGERRRSRLRTRAKRAWNAAEGGFEPANFRTCEPSNMAKYVFITGGVVSSLGKGVTSASLALLLKSRGYRVFMQKLDPYLNVDPGTMSAPLPAAARKASLISLVTWGTTCTVPPR